MYKIIITVYNEIVKLNLFELRYTNSKLTYK